MASAVEGLTDAQVHREEQQQKVSEALTKGVALFAALLGVIASRDGGIGRVVANDPGGFQVAVVFVVASVILAFGAWILVGTGTGGVVRATVWGTLMVLSVGSLGVGVAAYASADRSVGRQLERPTLAVMHGVDGLEFNARIDLLRADGYVRTTVHGYPPGDGEPELLFNSTSGPDADGKAVVRGAIRSDLSAYEVVEVRAHRGDRDPGCERPRREVHNEDVGPAACASVWIEPLVGT